jgi:hypothetical protein
MTTAGVALDRDARHSKAGVIERRIGVAVLHSFAIA